MTATTIAKRVGLVIAVLIAILILIVGGYVIYLEATYSRIADNVDAPVANNPETSLETDHTYTAVTYNIGFGAYTPDYTFFMDEGIMDDGTQTTGTQSRAVSKQSVEDCTAGSIAILKRLNPDFALIQEVDTDSDRSFHVNQKQSFIEAFPSDGSSFVSDFHSAFLAYPLTEPHGAVESGLLTLSRAYISSAVRRSYPVDGSFPAKYFDLDRCFEVMRIPVQNGHDLVLINSHMSAYDKGGKIRAQQLALIGNIMKAEYDTGNYVICGGDWNHALAGSEDIYPSKQQVPPWVSILDDADLPTGFSIVKADNLSEVASCRGCDIPYEKGVTYTTTVDGFIISDNVQAYAENIDCGFTYSDHNPVKLTFELQEALQ
ncbi:endonuclease/exonuclease/phosphatase family protein [Cryptobacterium curtum]|uniref:endonuclease/exonuclease/phosphatase family protein n=1 Tax=Cryptobacterium curtum TaxID=84163 RepID=UPI00248D41FA|nr:endonuclease/exonuclease/phosphatase family protein [Cryptobacterium curtum]